MSANFTYPKPPTITERHTLNDKDIFKYLSYVRRSLKYTYFRSPCTPYAQKYTYRVK